MPKATTEQTKKLGQLSSDCSFLLTHLIRKSESNPLEALQKILDINCKSDPKPKLESKPVGWYSKSRAKIYQPATDNQFKRPTKINGVCFTESTLMGLKAHREIFESKHGLAFSREMLYKRGANPCLNIRDPLLKTDLKTTLKYSHLYNYIPDNMAGLINTINEKFDSIDEREWRLMSDFEFQYSDIKFIFCPQNEFKLFSKTQNEGMPVLFDLMWLDEI